MGFCAAVSVEQPLILKETLAGAAGCQSAISGHGSGLHPFMRTLTTATGSHLPAVLYAPRLASRSGTVEVGRVQSLAKANRGAELQFALGALLSSARSPR
jgi:hypothetical protein